MAEKSRLLSIIVSSHDKASDLWEPFFRLFDLYWPDCPYSVFLVSNRKSGPRRPYLKTMTVGKDQHWASNLKKVLTRIDSEYILYLQDDYFFDRPVNQKLLSQGIKFLKQHRGACLRLMPSPRPDVPIHGSKLYGLISNDAKYRVCLQAGIWKKTTLMSLLVDGEDGWDMESKGTDRSKKMKEQFFSYLGGKKDKRKNIPISYFFIEPIENCFFTAVNQGYWLFEALGFLKSHGYNPYPTNRLVCSAAELFKYPERFYGSKKDNGRLVHQYYVQEILMAVRKLITVPEPRFQYLAGRQSPSQEFLQ